MGVIVTNAGQLAATQQSFSILRSGTTGEVVVTQLHGTHYEQARSGTVYTATVPGSAAISAAYQIKLYLHGAATTVSGTMPSSSQSATTANNTWAGNKLTMDPTIGTSQTSVAFSAPSGVTAQKDLINYHVSPPLNAGAISCVAASNGFSHLGAIQTSDATVAWSHLAGTLYLWRPSSGTKIATFFDNMGVSGGNATTAEASEVLPSFTGNLTTATAQAGDVLIYETWANYTQSAAATLTFYFDGTAETGGNGGATSSQASYLSVTWTAFPGFMSDAATLPYIPANFAFANPNGSGTIVIPISIDVVITVLPNGPLVGPYVVMAGASAMSVVTGTAVTAQAMLGGPQQPAAQVFRNAKVCPVSPYRLLETKLTGTATKKPDLPSFSISFYDACQLNPGSVLCVQQIGLDTTTAASAYSSVTWLECSP